MWNPRKLFARTRPVSVARKLKPQVERLECRETPATITGTFSAGVLTLTGSNSNDQITITAPAAQNRLAGVFGVTGVGDTVVAGTHAVPIEGGMQWSGVTSIVCKMGAGSDTVAFGRGNLPGTLAFEGADGDDTLLVGTAGVNDHVFAKLTFIGGNGDDLLRLQNGNNRVVHQLKYDGGHGDNTLDIGFGADDRTTLGSLAVTNGNGFDRISSAGRSLIVNSTITINNGANTDVQLDKGSLIDFQTTENFVVGNATTITNGKGDDTCIFGAPNTGVVSLRGVSIKNGDDLSVTRFQANVNTLSANLFVSGNHDAKFIAQGAQFIIGGEADLFARSNDVDLHSLDSVQILRGIAVLSATSAAGYDVELGTNNQTDVVLGDTIVMKSPELRFRGRKLTINGGLYTTDTGVSITGERFNVAEDIVMANGRLHIDNLTTMIGGPVTIKGAPETVFSSLYATDIGGKLSVTGGDVRFDEGFITAEATKLADVRDVVFNAPTAFHGALTITSKGGMVDTNNRLETNSHMSITGASYVYLDAPQGAGIYGNLTVAMREGGFSDLIQVGGLLVGGNVGLDTDGGADTVIINDCAFNGALSTFGGNYTFGGTANAMLAAALAHVGDVTFNSETTMVILTIASNGGTIDTNNYLEVLGDLKITGAGSVYLDALQATAVYGKLTVNTRMGNFADRVSIHRAVVGGLLNIDTSDGDDTVTIDDSVFFAPISAGNSKIVTGGGNDTVKIDEQDTGTHWTEFMGYLNVSLGAGDDDMTIGRAGDDDDFAIFAGVPVVDGGTGTDKLHHKGNTHNVFGSTIAPTVKFLEQHN